MLIEQTKGKYLIIISDGTLRLAVPEGTEGAVKREYELKDGTKGSKWEKVYKAIKGYITSMWFYEGDYGKILNVKIKDGEDTAVIQFNTKTTFGEDFMKKLPNIKLDEEVVIRPFSFEDEEGKNRKGVAMTQGQRKIENFFWDKEAKKGKNGYPTPDGDTKSYDGDDWISFYTKVRKFLIQYIQENLLPKLAKNEQEAPKIDYPEDDISISDIPF